MSGLELAAPEKKPPTLRFEGGEHTAIGDDTLQKQAKGYAVPDSFTHGSSEQRVRWFKRGMESGQLAACNTFQGRGGL